MTRSSSKLHIVILAAGKGTRMKSARAKVLHVVAGRTMIDYVLDAVEPLGAARTVVVIGHDADRVRAHLVGRRVEFVVQQPQAGTGHALMAAESALGRARGTVLVLYGDVPLLRTATLEKLVALHRSRNAAATVLTVEVDDPAGYGRIVRDANGQIERIVEERDATPADRTAREINSGIYCFDLETLFPALRLAAADNAQREYYLPDLVAIFRKQGRVVETLLHSDASELAGINSRRELADISAIVRCRITGALMAEGVTIVDPAHTYIDAGVSVGRDTIIHPFVHIEGKTKIGEYCTLHAHSRIVDSTIEDGVTIHNFCVISGARIRSEASVGPFAHIRAGSEVAPEARVGTFVELKKTLLGRGSKAQHLAYLGDARIGARVNVGAGTITCNYDGTKKHPTVIEDDVFIGSDSQLIAPVRVGKGAYVAAGSSITDDVPPESLAIARSRQVVKKGWVRKKKRR